MRKKIIYLLLWITIPVSAQFENSQRKVILNEIEKNNTTLIALRQQATADKALNNANNALSDPNVGFSYSWGNHKGMPGKKTFSAEQELDWGTITGQRAKTAESGNKVIDWNYQIQRQEILAEADLLLVTLTYQNALCEEYCNQKERAANLEKLYLKKLAVGDANQIEINKVKLFHTAATAAYHRACSDRTQTLANIKRLNGNTDLSFNSVKYEETALPLLEDLLSRAKSFAPLIQLASANTDNSRQELKLSQRNGLPAISVGYTGEHVGGNNYNGVSVGMSIPLWGKTRKEVKQKRANQLAAELNELDVIAKITAKLKEQYHNASNLRRISQQFKLQLNENEDTAILQKALNAGLISLIEYLNEIAFYDNARVEAIEVEKDFQIALSDLYKIFR